MTKKKESKYYLAYGSNLNLEQMARRCPGAAAVGSAVINGYRLLFRGTPGNTHATVEPAFGYSVPVLVWETKKAHEAALDVYEGFPNYYYKEFFSIRIGKNITLAMLYVMTEGRRIGAPSKQYYNAIVDGYDSAGFNVEILETALRESL